MARLATGPSGRPGQNWGPYRGDDRPNSELLIEFGRPVEIEPKYNGQRQAFPIEKRIVTWMKFTKLVDRSPGGYAAFVEVEAYGKPAP